MDEFRLRSCENCRYAEVYDGLTIVGCLLDGSMRDPTDECSEHRFKHGHSGGRKKIKDE